MMKMKLKAVKTLLRLLSFKSEHGLHSLSVCTCPNKNVGKLLSDDLIIPFSVHVLNIKFLIVAGRYFGTKVNAICLASSPPVGVNMTSVCPSSIVCNRNIMLIHK